MNLNISDPRFYPPLAFYFNVQVVGAAGLGLYDNSFQEVSGLDVSFETEEIKEGGENRFAYTLPTRKKYSNLVLKRGIIPIGSLLSIWVNEVLESDLSSSITPKTILVNLLSPDGYGIIPLKTWKIEGAYPIKWQVSNFDAMKNEIAIETIEFAYKYFTNIL